MMAKPAFRTGSAEVYLGVRVSPISRQRFVHAENVSSGKVIRRYYAPPIRTGRAVFVLRKQLREDGRLRSEIVEGWSELGRFAVQEAKR